jgi:gliding motility-associated-like protein
MANEFTVHVTNSDPASILRGETPSQVGTGFVSTTLNGKLVRNTNTTDNYLFPLGSRIANAAMPAVTTLYRPVEIKPANTSPNSFSVALMNNDASNEGYDKTKKTIDIKSVSDKYYYILNQPTGSSNSNVIFYQNSAVEDGYTQLVRWATSLQWERALLSIFTSGAFGNDLNGSILNTSNNYSATGPISNTPFTFSSKSEFVNPFTFFNAFSPDGDNRNDTWEIQNIESFPDNKLTIYNRWGDEVYSVKGYTNAKAWDGGNLQSGTYYYVLTANIENQARAFKGFITMVKKN